MYSEEAKGSCFKIYFPIRDNDHNSQSYLTKNEENKPGASIQNKFILIVDDEPSMLGIANSLLTSMGYTIFTAENAMNALEIIKRNKIDLVITDIIMAGEMNGITLAKLIKDRYPEIKIILTSGFPGHLHKKEEAELTKYPFIEKPYKIKELEKMVLEELR